MSFIAALHMLAEGALATLTCFLACLGVTFCTGVILGAIYSRKLVFINNFIVSYVYIMRGIPPLMVLLTIAYMSEIAQPFIAALLGLSIYHTAYVAEIVRGGIAAIPRGQYEAAAAIGLKTYQTLIYVIIPQVWLAIIPSLAGQYILVLKDTALLSVVGVRDMMRIGKQLMQITNPLVVYAAIAIFYYVLCTCIQQAARAVEHHLRRGS